MSTSPLSDDLAREAVAAWRAHDGRTSDAAAALGLKYGTFRSRLKVGQQRGFHLSPGVQSVVHAAKLHPAEARGGWLHSYDENGKKTAATYWRPQDTPAEGFADRIRQALVDMPPAPKVTLETAPDSDVITLVPVADAHIGLMAWGRETGEDWDTRKGAERLTNWVGRTLAALQPSHRCVLLFAGDLLHADDGRSETPAGKHRLDTDTRYFKMLESTVEAVAQSVDMALARHETVTARFLPGNHDPHAAVAVMMALAERYRSEPRVVVQRDPSEFYVYQFGRVLIAAHHGHKAKADRMVHYIADEYAILWGKTRFRYLFTGHLHHHKSQDIGGMTREELPAISARDAYTVSNAYVARARLTGITYHRERGEIARVVTGSE
jgi:hypothetical protein